MAQSLRVGILGAGWPGTAHAQGYQAAGGFKLEAVADLIPARRKKLISTFGIPREMVQAEEMIADRQIDVISICLPTHLHLPMATEALRAGKHVVCEPAPGLSAKDARALQRTADKSGKVLMYGFQRRYGAAEQAAHQAIAKGYAGEIYHARASWTRTRSIPAGTGWYWRKETAGGGALMDLGLHLLDLTLHLMGSPAAESVFAMTHRKLDNLYPADRPSDVEEAGFGLIRLQGGRSMELASSWAINQSPSQNGTVCRLYGTKGSVEVYTSQGAVLYRQFDAKGQGKATPLKGPKVFGHAAMMRHLRECIVGKVTPQSGPAQGVAMMELIDALYKSADTGKSVSL